MTTPNKRAPRAFFRRPAAQDVGEELAFHVEMRTRELIASGMTPDRFAEIVAMGATRPVYPDQPDRAENRRITIVLKAEASALPSDSSFKF
jgi:hypothetical protein